MRAMAMVLILVNLLLGATLTASRRSEGGSADWFRDCCRGTGPAAYCCLDCCVLIEDCDSDSDCQES